MCLDSKCGRQHVSGHYKRLTVGGSKLDEPFVAFTRQAPLLKLSVLDFNIDPHLTAHPTPNTQEELSRALKSNLIPDF